MEIAKNLEKQIEQKILSAVERMPAFPRSVQKILELSNNINCPPKDLVAVIEKDPVMTMKILKVINSAYYSLPNRISSVSQSVVYLGMNTVKNLALAIAAVGVLPSRNPQSFNVQHYLIHSLSTASLARQLCSVANGNLEPSDAYIAGLLHDFGKVVLAQYMSNEYQQVLTLVEQQDIPLDQAEREILGVDHALVGAMLTCHWQFPYELSQCIADHHNPNAEPNLMLDCVKVANQISRRAKIGDGHNPYHPGERPVSKRFGDYFGSILLKVGDLDTVRAEAESFASLSSS